MSKSSSSGRRIRRQRNRLCHSASSAWRDAAVAAIQAMEPRLLLTRIVYVDDSAPAGGDGTSWARAWQDLQAALVPALSGDEIHVGQGTYKPTTGADRAASFTLKSNVALYGGYAGYGSASPDARNPPLYPSVLSGDIGAAGGSTDNSYHVVTATATGATAILDGFTVTRGNASSSGGGMYNSGSSPTVTNCTFGGNSATSTNLGSSGGGMYNTSSSPTVTNCTFSANSASSGGGMYNYASSSPVVSNCTFSGNSATSDYGSAMYNMGSSPTVTSCTFTANLAPYSGAMENNAASPRVSNCTFSGNSATAQGGSGGGIDNIGSSPTVTNCTFVGNSAYYGGGIYNYFAYSSPPTVTNCTFSGNSATSYGGGMYNHGSSPKLIDCTLAANAVGASGHGAGVCGTATITNCILWGNTPASASRADGVFTSTYTDIQQTGYAGRGNLNGDPLFVRNPSIGGDNKWGTADDDYGDLHLQATSPCIDAGSNAAIPAGITTDLAGRPRRIDIPTRSDTGSGTAPVVDMGAYEATIATIALSATTNGWYLSLSSDRQTLRVWQSAAPSGNPSATYTAGGYDTLRVTGGAGNDTLTIDLSNGSPLPAGGMTFDGGIGTDTLVITGTGAADSLTVGSPLVTLSSAVVTPTNVESIRLDNPAGSLVQLASLTLTDTGKVSLASGGGKVLKVGALSIAGAAVLDLGTSSLIVQADAGTPSPDGVLGQVTGWIAAGRIVAPADPYRGLAAIRNDRGNGVAAMGVFEQQAVNGRSVLVKYTLNGDTDLNGKIDAADYLRADYGFVTGKSGYRFGDFNRSGAITADDYGMIDAAFLSQSAMPGAKAVAPVVSSRSGTAVGRIRAASSTTKRSSAGAVRRGGLMLTFAQRRGPQPWPCRDDSGAGALAGVRAQPAALARSAG